MCTEPDKQVRDACFVEQRRNHRLDIRLDLVVRHHNKQEGSIAVEKTHTRNISSGDAFFETSLGDRLKVGDSLDIDIRLPSTAGPASEHRLLEATATVVRLTSDNVTEPNRKGVAVVFESTPEFHTSFT